MNKKSFIQRVRVPVPAGKVVEARTDYKKRLNAYWKRFGASKLHTWTYWTER